jgi:uncharacterized alkaline shock family protein YloU
LIYTITNCQVRLNKNFHTCSTGDGHTQLVKVKLEKQLPNIKLYIKVFYQVNFW